MTHRTARILPGQLTLDLVSTKAGAKARDRALKAVAAATGEWQVDALAAIRKLALEKPAINTDDVWKELGRDPNLEGRAMGAAMVAAAKLRLIRRTNMTTKSRRAACHRRDLRVWESLIWKGRAP